MNLEDRLRSHMHSGEDLFDGRATSADDIAASGHRRTRRNQMGVAVVGGLFAIGGVFGATQLLGGADDVEVAQSEPEISAIQDAEDEMLESSDAIDASDSAMFDGELPPFDTVIGVADGFAGLRNTNGVFTAIRSTDGLVWDEIATNGLEDDLQVGVLAFGDGVFAAVFVSIDSNGAAANFIGTSEDLADWELVQVFTDAPDASMSGLAVADGTVVSGATVFSNVDEESASSNVEGFVLSGPVGGPYVEVPLDAAENGIDQIVPIEPGFALSSFGDAAPRVSTTGDGTQWEAATPANVATQFSTIATLDGALLSIGSTDIGGSGEFEIFRSADAGQSWSAVGVPSNLVDAPWWSFDVRSSGDVAAVLLVGESDEEVEGLFISRHALITSAGDDFVEIDLRPYADVAATVLLVGVSSDEVLLQVIDPPEDFDESLASSSGVANEVPDGAPADDGTLSEEDVFVVQDPTQNYVRVPLK